MGYWGNAMLLRADVELADLATVRAAGGEAEESRAFDSGWRITRVHGADGLSRAQVAAVAVEAGGPFLSGYIVDSDFVVVQFAGPGTAVFEFVLHDRIADEYGYPVDPAVQAAAPARLAAWAGPGADEEQVRTAVTGRLTFAEDSFERLAAAAGAFPMAELADHLFGSLTD